MLQGQTIEVSTVVAFRPMPHRRVRAESNESERGTLLLFTGVRYERVANMESLADLVARQPDSDEDGA